MATRNYVKLPIEQFGRILIESGDLDPVYNAIVNSGWDMETRCRWMVAYWCFYHSGFACFAASHKGEHFWDLLATAAENILPNPLGDRWPRGSERRHFRGKAGVASIQHLRDSYKDPEDMVRHCAGPSKHAMFEHINRRAKLHRGFGDWMGFKIADMIDRCTPVEVDFDVAHLFMFKDPEKAATMVWTEAHKGQEMIPRKQLLTEVVEHLINEFNDLPAPPNGDRQVGIPEVETVLCKWKSHMNGHYPLYHDTREIRKQVVEWSSCSLLARSFEKALPTGDLKND